MGQRHPGHPTGFQQRHHASDAQFTKNVPDRSVIRADDFLLYATAVLGITLPGLVFVCYSMTYRWYHGRFGGPTLLEGEEEILAEEDTPTVDDDGRMRHGRETDTATAPSSSHPFDDRPSAKPSAAVIYASETGTARQLATVLSQSLAQVYQVFLSDMAVVDIEDFVELDVTLIVFVVATWIDGCAPEKCQPFFDALHDLCGQPLSHMKFAVFAIGSGIYEETYNAVGKDVYDVVVNLGGRPFLTIALADESKTESIEHQFTVWQRNVLTLAADPARIERAAIGIHRRRVECVGKRRKESGGESKVRRRREKLAESLPSSDEN